MEGATMAKFFGNIPTGNDKQDAERAKELAKDQKENSEHVMLVDLARNDLMIIK